MIREFDKAVQKLLDEFEFLKEEYEDLKEDGNKLPRMLFVVADVSKQDPSSCAKAILSRLAGVGNISVDEKSLEELGAELISFWSERNAPDEVKVFTREFRSHVRELVRLAVEANKDYQKKLSSNKGRKTGTYVSFSNGKYIVNQDSSADLKKRTDEEPKALIKDFRTKLDAALKKDIQVSDVVSLTNDFLNDVLEVSIKELGASLKELPITDLAVELTNEAITRLIAPQWFAMVKAADETFKNKYKLANYNSTKFSSSFHDRLHRALDEAYSLGQRPYTGGGAKR